jgi:AraC family transcriptional regulator
MIPNSEIFIMTAFPDFNVAGFDMEKYNERFKKRNVIIHAKSKDVSYPEHWGCLSIKCAFNGSEYYESGNHFYTVNENNYLIFNEGKYYSSRIFSHTTVESFTVNFSAGFEREVSTSLLSSCEDLLDNFERIKERKIEFIEKLYPHDEIITPVLSKLYRESLKEEPDGNFIDESYHQLLERLILLQKHVWKEVQKIKAVKPSTKIELYKRLHYAKDYIDSCYTSSITLEQLASIAFLNNTYFLRTFKRFFNITPYQYVIRKRLEHAKKLLRSQHATVSEVCCAVGYEDVRSFTILFENNFGITPEAYQQQSSKKAIFTC